MRAALTADFAFLAVDRARIESDAGVGIGHSKALLKILYEL